MPEKVLVALSGGIDSAMAAIMLKQQGFIVEGIHFDFFDQPSLPVQEKLDQLGDFLQINISRHDAKNIFCKIVIAHFTQSHLQGKTPSPCVICNSEVKWMLLYELACKKGFNFFATGHYVRIVHEIYGTRINRGIDAKKDQSYYLWRIDQRLLERAICPLGEHYKEDVKESALRIGLGFLTKSKESSGLCFAGEKSYTQLLHQYIDKTNLPGEGIIVDRKGSHIGRHRGYIFYTIGQKKELDLDLKEKLCVAEIDPTRNLIRVDTWQSLYMNSFNIEDCHFFNEEELNSGLPIRTRIRGFGLNPEGNTRIRRIGQNRFKVELEHAAWAIASGQPAVFYSGDKLLGGGIVS